MRFLTGVVGALAAFSSVASADENNRVLKGVQRPKIVNGQPAPVGRYPYIAGLKFSTGAFFPGCGGTLIAPNIVLSAGHCSGPVRVTVGCYDLNSPTSTCETFTIAQQTVHPNYVGSPVPVNDFMVLRLSGNSVNAPVAHVASATSVIPEGFDLTVMGWGTTSSGGSQSSILLEVDVDYVNNAQCETQYAVEQAGLIKPSMICGARPGKDSCQGDSGGPLIIRCDLFEEDILVGDVSWGIGCADPGFPGVYGRLSTGLAFVEPLVTAQGHSLSKITDVGTFCTLGGTFAPTPPTIPPTPFPTIPAGWICNNAYYNAHDGCDCECGAVDPDCSIAGQTLYGCTSGSGQVCSAEGHCVLPGATSSPTTGAPTGPVITFFPTVSGVTNSPTPAVTAAPVTPAPTIGSDVPAEWVCNPNYYNSHDGCDCECGVFDPDCNDEYGTLYNCGLDQTCSDEGLCVGGTPLPAEWTCNAQYYNAADACDCNCGAYDPDCDRVGMELFGCSDNQGCNSEGLCFDLVIAPTGAPAGPIITEFPTSSVPTPQLTAFPTTSPVGSPTTRAPTMAVETLPPSFINLPTDIEIVYVLAGVALGALLSVFVVCCFFGSKSRKAKRVARKYDAETDGKALVAGKGALL